MSISSANIIGANSAFGRNEADFYPTPPECTLALLDHWKPPHTIWEPACGDGAIAKVLEGAGHCVIASDLHDRGYGDWTGDFLNDPPRTGFGAIITNPPFNVAEPFIRTAASYGVPFAMLLKSTYWHAATRAKLFAETRPEMVIAMTWRPSFDLRHLTHDGRHLDRLGAETVAKAVPVRAGSEARSRRVRMNGEPHFAKRLRERAGITNADAVYADLRVALADPERYSDFIDYVMQSHDGKSFWRVKLETGIFYVLAAGTFPVTVYDQEQMRRQKENRRRVKWR